MSAYGYEIVQTLIVDIEPDEHVKRAMNEINAGKYCPTCLARCNQPSKCFLILCICLFMSLFSCKNEGCSK